MSEGVDVEIIIEGGEEIIKLQKNGKEYTYVSNEISNDVVDRLISGGSEYTVYSQEEILSKEEYEAKWGAWTV